MENNQKGDMEEGFSERNSGWKNNKGSGIDGEERESVGG